MFLPPLRLTGATVLRDGKLQQRSLAIANGRITKGPLPAVDLSGYYILPGIIDLHGDAFERHLVPRPTTDFPLDTGLRATDHDAASNGVTTAWLAQGWSWEGGKRGPDYAENVLKAMDAYRPQMLTDMRIQIRCETHTTHTKDRLLAAVERHGVDYVIFNNHLEAALLLAHAKPHNLAQSAQKAGRTLEDHINHILVAKAQEKSVPRYLCNLAEAFDQLGVLYGSHDDPDGNARETYSLIGAKICEFPTTRSPAALANAVNDPVVMGAPNVVLGGSHKGYIAASDLIRAKMCNALVSDYNYPALSQAAFKLVDEGTLPLEKSWALISQNPAHIMRLHDRGRIDYGLRADLTIVNKTTRAVEATICKGRITHLSGQAANRFLNSEEDLLLAAE